MIISLSFWKGSPNFYIKTIGPKKTPLVGRGLVNHQIPTRGVFLIKYEFSKHPFDVSLITLFLLGGGWSWQAELTRPVQQFIADYLIYFQKLNLIIILKLSFIFDVI
jgi:hypothetical protein